MVFFIAFGLQSNCYPIFILAMILGCCSLEIKTTVDIVPSKIRGENMIITCSVSSTSLEDVRNNLVYLHCPLLGNDKICYINCESLLVTLEGNPIHTEVFESCENTWKLKNRVEYQYILNRRLINVEGQWHCAYKNQKSSNITIQRYKDRPLVKKIVSTTKTLSETTPGTSTCSQTTFCPVQSNNLSMIAGIITALCVSAICNVLLSLIFCFSRFERRCKRRNILKDDTKYRTEQVSMLSRNSNRHIPLNQSSCSRTPSLDSPSNKGSFSTYIQDTIHSNSFQSPTYYVCPDYKLINISPNDLHGFNIEGPNVLLRHNSEESNSVGHAFAPAMHLTKGQPQRRSAQIPCRGYSPQNPGQQSFLAGRTCFSHQQLLNDSNDESGLGSESICNYNIHKPMSLVGGSDTVDLIHYCDTNLYQAKPSMDISS